MKQFPYLLLMVLLYPFFLSAQSVGGSKKKKCKGCKSIISLAPITIDFTAKENVVYQSIVPQNSSVDIIIENVNLKVVDTTKNIERQTFNEIPPKLFETLSKATLPDAGEPGAGMASRETTLFSASQIHSGRLQKQKFDLEQRYKKINGQINDRLDNLKLYRDVIYQVKFLLQYQNDLTYKQNDCNKRLDDLKSEVDKLTQDYFKNEKMGVESGDRGAITARTQYADNRGIISRHIASLIAKEQETYDKLVVLFAPGNMSKLEEDINALGAEIQKVNVNRAPETQALAKELRDNPQVLELEPAFTDLKHYYELAAVPKLHADFSNFSTTGKDELLKTYDYFERGHFVHVVSVPLIKEDEVNVSIDITPKTGAPCAVVPRHYTLTFRPKGKIKIDFSSGLFVNFGGNDFKDQSYRYEDIEGNGDSSVIRKNKGKNSVFPSIGALMHIYWRNGKDFHPAFTFGLSTKDLDRINYHLGGSLIFGYSQRYIISAGGTLTKARLIDDKYEEGQKVRKPDVTATVPTANFNRFGFFLSFTYNVSAK
ncbi:hypothetical protein [Chitinophaga eiseniae]|uniref:Uncharacterized protein n=1 Tax=Chitinophaga eiseniae TaxID=634771 RepID=A0A847SVK4_9BACT|nr:hypothetical protein [Chitinophaga eiseniae]NLR82508.1 hypothetical protein [Chitinophaga eiseniae]